MTQEYLSIRAGRAPCLPQLGGGLEARPTQLSASFSGVGSGGYAGRTRTSGRFSCRPVTGDLLKAANASAASSATTLIVKL